MVCFSMLDVQNYFKYESQFRNWIRNLITRKFADR